MSPINTNWTRLIRFVAVETSMVHIGQPLDPNIDIGIAYHNKEIIKVHEIIGSALDPNAEVSQTVLTVQALLSPLSRDEVGTVRCMGLNYADHAAELKMAKPAAPILFFKPKTSLIGPGANISIPKVAQPVDVHLPDWEVELTVVIGKPCKEVSEKHALDYVLGYMAGNDTSFRYHQMMTTQWGFSKGFDNATPIGPCIVSAKAIPDPQQLPLKSIVNGTVMQDGDTSDQLFTIAQIISYFSQGMTLEPGSIIMTGTPSGIGFGRNPSIYLKHGDDVRMWIGGGLGTLINTVYEEGRDDGTAPGQH